MKNWGNLLLITMIVLLQNMPVEVDSQGDEPHAFYFIQQWLPSYCNQEGTPCCYPTTGKPGANFTIYGLWPYNDNGASLENCPGASFDVGPLKGIESMLEQEWATFTCPQIGRKFWLHEWNKHGACSKSVFQEIQYFEAALNLKNKFNILQILGKANIYPDNEFYPIETIKDVLFQATGLQPLIYCNRDAQENSQIWQILMCVDKTGMELVNCSNLSDGQRECTSTIKFPSF